MKKEILQEPANPNKKAIKGTAEIKQKSEFRKFTEDIFASNAKNLKDQIVHEILIPSAKKFVLDAVNTVLYGTPSRSSSTFRNYSSVDGNRDYNSISKNRNNSYRSDIFRCEEVIVDDMAEVNRIINELENNISDYGFTRVLDYYEAAGVSDPSNNWALGNYGWSNINGWNAVPYNGRYLLTMPKASRIQQK